MNAGTMRMRSARLLLLLGCPTSVLTLFLVAPSVGEASGAGVPLALAVLLVAVLLVAVLLVAVLATADVRCISTRAVRVGRYAVRLDRAPARQGDPDAAGHTRSRAPSAPFVR